MINKIALDTNKAKEISEKLNDLLANYSVFYINLRGYHWNIKGDRFFELHVKFEELYTDTATRLDEIAERILTLGGIPLHTYSDYIGNSAIKENPNVSDGLKAVGSILESYETIIGKMREIMEAASEAGDEGTATLISDYITQLEKTVWMYSSYYAK